MKKAPLAACVALLLLCLPLTALAGNPPRSGEAEAAAAEPAARRRPSRPRRATPAFVRCRTSVTLAGLDNGLTVIVQENHVAPVATVRCYVKNTGSAFEGRYLGAGLSHVLEHVVAGGTTTRHTEKEIQRIIERLRRRHQRLSPPTT